MIANHKLTLHLGIIQVSRIKEAIEEALNTVINNKLALPFKFHYVESEYIGERWHFVIHNIVVLI